jgi:hypothetical protein
MSNTGCDVKKRHSQSEIGCDAVKRDIDVIKKYLDENRLAVTISCQG